MILINITLLLITIFVSFYILPVLIKLAVKYNITDKPDDNLKTQIKPIPYLGGIGIYISSLIGIIILSLILTNYPQYLKNISVPILWNIFFASTIIMILGLIDDIKDLGPIIKLFIEFLVAVVLIRCDIFIQIRFFPDIINFILTILWVLTMTNALNLIDIMDGLCSGIVIIISITFIIIGYLTGNNFTIFMGIIITGSTLPFYFLNKTPAKMYLGDTGSLFLGFILSALAMSISYTNNNILGLFVPSLILGIPLYEIVVVIIFRLISGKSPLKGSKDHFALRLLKSGFSKKEAVRFIYLISIVLSLFSIIIINVNIKAAILIYFCILLTGYIFGKLLSKIKVPS